MNGVRAPDRVRSSFRKTEEAHFAFLNEFRHLANGLFNWCVWIDAMLVVEINHIHTQPAQAAVACFADVIGLAADAAVVRPGWVTQNSKLCGNDRLLAMPSQCTPEQLFIRVRAVHIGC